MNPTIKVKKLEDTGYAYSDNDWDFLCELFNESEYSDEIDLCFADTEAWERLAEYNKILHDVLFEYYEDDKPSITIYE